MSNDPAPGGEQPGWQGQQPYPGSYGQQHGEQPAYPGAYAPGGQQGGYGQAPPPWAAPGPAPQRAGYPAGPPPGPAGLGPGGPQEPGAQGLFGALFDFNFNSFATPVVIKFLYILGLIGIAGLYVIYVVVGFLSSAMIGLIVLVLGGIGALFGVMMLRTTLEFYYALVRMSEDVRAMRRLG